MSPPYYDRRRSGPRGSKNIISFEGVLTKLDRFDSERLTQELESNMLEIDPGYLTGTDYGFDLLVVLISKHLGRTKLLDFLLEFEDSTLERIRKIDIRVQEKSVRN